MKLKLTLARPTGADVDVVITTDVAATVRDVAAELLVADPLSPAQVDVPTDSTLQVSFPGAPSSRILDPDTPIAEAVIASGARVQVVQRGGSSTTELSPPVGIMRVDAGPDQGRDFELRVGSMVIGREQDSDLRLTDPLVSKRHARLEVGDTVDLIDLNSANGIVVGGGEVTRVSLTSGQTVTLGDTVLRIELFVRSTPVETATRVGPIAFNRSPRIEARYPGEQYDGPDVPRESEPIGFPWLALVAPLLMGPILYAFTQSPLSLVFVALSPIMMAGTYFTQRMRERRKLKADIEKFTRKLSQLGQLMEKEVTLERQVRLAEAPSTEELLDDADCLGPLLWTRRPEHWSFLNVRLGIGTAPSRNEIRGKNNANGLPEYAERLDATIDYFEHISGVPIVDSLRDAGALGLSGDEVPVLEATHSVLVQLAALHSPAELAFSAILSPSWSKDLEWIKWLPHTGATGSPLPGVHLADGAATGTKLLADLEELVESRLSASRERATQNRGALALDDAVMARGAEVGDEKPSSSDQPPELPCVIVVISDDAPIDRARVTQLIEKAPAAGVFPIWIATTRTSLPAACRTFLEVHEAEPKAKVGLVRTGQLIDDVEISRVSTSRALEFARRLAAVADAGAFIADESDIPRSVSFLDLLGHDMATSSEAVIDRWNQNESVNDRTPDAPLKARRAGKLRAVVGQSNVDSLHLDLRTHGPHALVGGTTGAGKSEFLQAWVLGMAAEYSPDRVTFLFVDYKGGSAFADCVDLPHTVGLVTDLSPHLVRRALTSLRAELHFREHLFNRKKVKDLIELEKRGDPECPPALVLVIDEFAALVGEVPEFVDGVVDIAQRGRSLGIHLIMATQRPAGVIKDNLRANTNLRVALRMADESDSTDVVGSAVAAGFDPSVPGRGIAKTGPGRLTSFQTGYAGGWTSDAQSAPSVEVAELAFGIERKWEAPKPQGSDEDVNLGPNDTARLVTSMSQAATAAGIPAPRKPWLDELSPVYDLSMLRQRTDAELVIGVVDDAEKQSQYPVYFRPDIDGHLAVYGTGGSGKSVALRSLAIAAAITPRGGPVQVYALDFASGGLRMLEALPHVGAVIGADDTERVGRLIRMLREMIDDRVLRYGAVRASTVAEYRALASQPKEPRVLLLIDGMATFRQEYEFTASSSLFNQFLQVLSDGRQVGIHVIVSADRPGSISPSVSASFQRKVTLRLTDENDYAMVDAPSDVLSAASPPGRAVLDQLETQVAVFGGTANVAEQARAIEKLAKAMRDNGIADAPAIERLAGEIALSELRGARTRPGQIAIGVASDDLQPFAIVPEGAFMLTGPPASGRSTALATLAQALREGPPGVELFYFGNARSSLSLAPGWSGTATSPDVAATLAKSLLERASAPATQGARLAILIESITDFLSTPADQDLTALIKAAKRNDHFVVAESENSTWSQSWPLLMEFKAARRGFALQPEPHEGDLLFKTSFPRIKRSEFPEGRGNFVQAGKVRTVQMALPDI
ncbi:FtsK/SpoIIIE domain-containing protein [Salinibacterium sp. SYSU T00001]|uniref:FtsK/SpoIIIE domain-containing protein n=1 Tax=Homoserinimonas sedimenticola TaxID=2986805 RepID=UPI0022358FC9|nr:FtsK/SpoIIIE domain-containing protein [Salinibacterium sedimenticola]MCW4384917.1 FtsK/SpoIIIE domain-containing protein [Salinibacterium sedimenticola]